MCVRQMISGARINLAEDVSRRREVLRRRRGGRQ
eukprot:SAG11_NODE_32724_length_281_cov_0.851648_1_plen_33_part_10